MRGILLSLALAFVIIGARPATSSTLVAAPAFTAAAAPVYALQIPDKVDVDINVGQKGSGAWYRSPIWIAIGAVAFVVILLMVVLIARGGGGTTIVKE
jgi:hypothetical protein